MSEEECEENNSPEGTTKFSGGAEKTGSKYDPIESMNIGEGFGDTPIKLCPDD